MNGIDLALGLFVLAAGLRGAWRGFFREAFAAVALVGATLAAFQLGDAGASYAQDLAGQNAPQSLLSGVAFVSIFSVVYVIIAFVGLLLERRMGSSTSRMMSAIAGAGVGLIKGVALAAFVTLFLYLFVPQRSAQLTDSRVARMLLNAAGNALRIADPYVAPAAPLHPSWIR